MAIEDTLKNVPIFSELGKRDLSRIGRLMHSQSYGAGKVIISEGEQAAGFFVVSSGKVEVVKGAAGANPKVLNTLGPGEFFGEMALFEGFPRDATVRALEDTECLAMTRWDFSSEMKSNPEVAVSMLSALVRRLRNTQAGLTE
jgi:CRP-like cAMP-binding protein